jgi:hypothetical protein
MSTEVVPASGDPTSSLRTSVQPPPCAGARRWRWWRLCTYSRSRDESQRYLCGCGTSSALSESVHNRALLAAPGTLYDAAAGRFQGSRRSSGRRVRKCRRREIAEVARSAPRPPCRSHHKARQARAEARRIGVGDHADLHALIVARWQLASRLHQLRRSETGWGFQMLVEPVNLPVVMMQEGDKAPPRMRREVARAFSAQPSTGARRPSHGPARPSRTWPLEAWASRGLPATAKEAGSRAVAVEAPAGGRPEAPRAEPERVGAAGRPRRAELRPR